MFSIQVKLSESDHVLILSEALRTVDLERTHINKDIMSYIQSCLDLERTSLYFRMLGENTAQDPYLRYVSVSYQLVDRNVNVNPNFTYVYVLDSTY
jgi:hypothetical protein